MAAQKLITRKESEWVGNCVYYVMGINKPSRKSYPRNSKGFEPLDAYFKDPTPDTDSDSDSGTEELVQQRLAEARWRRQLAREQREREEKEREKERERKKERKKEREREREALSKPTPPTEDCTVSSPSRNEQSSHSTSDSGLSKHSLLQTEADNPSDSNQQTDPSSGGGVESLAIVETIQAGALETTFSKSKAPARKETATKSPLSKAPARKETATKSPSSKAPARKETATKPSSSKAPARKETATKSTSSKAPARKETATKSPLSKAPARKETATKPPSSKASVHKETATKPSSSNEAIHTLSVNKSSQPDQSVQSSPPSKVLAESMEEDTTLSKSKASTTKSSTTSKITHSMSNTTKTDQDTTVTKPKASARKATTTKPSTTKSDQDTTVVKPKASARKATTTKPSTTKSDQDTIVVKPKASARKATTTKPTTEPKRNTEAAKPKVPTREVVATKPLTSSKTVHAHSVNKSGEQFYSPEKSMQLSPSSPGKRQPSPSPSSKRLMPSKLSFDSDSPSDTDAHTRIAPTRIAPTRIAPTRIAPTRIAPTLSSKETANKSKRRKTKSISMPAKKKSANPPPPSDPSPNPPPPSDPSPTLGVESHTDTGFSTTISFNPPISSTLNPEQIIQEATKKKPTRKREISSIRPVKRGPLLQTDSSDSEPEADQTLHRLLRGVTSKMQSLQARAHRAAEASKPPLDSLQKSSLPTEPTEKEREPESELKGDSSNAKKQEAKKPKGRRKSTVSMKKASTHKKSKTVPSTQQNDSPPEDHQFSPPSEPLVTSDSFELAETVFHSPAAKETHVPRGRSNTRGTRQGRTLKIRRLSIVLTKTTSPSRMTTRSQRSLSTGAEEVTLPSRRKTGSRVGMPRSKKGKKASTLEPLEETVTTRTRGQSIASSTSSLSGDESSNELSKSSRSKRSGYTSEGSTVTSKGKGPGKEAAKSLVSGSGYLSDYENRISSAVVDNTPPSDSVRMESTPPSDSVRGESPTSSDVVMGELSDSVRGESPTDVSVLPRLTRKRKKPTQTAPPRKRPKGSKPDETTDTDEDFDLTLTPGGREYRRLKVGPGLAKTPGVRRSQRTRIAPVRPWLNEKVEYDMRRKSGVSLKALLVPTYEVDEALAPRRRQDRRRVARDESEPTEGDFENMAFQNSSGSEEEWVAVRTTGYGVKLDGKGQPATELSDVILQRMCSVGSMTYGRLLLDPLALKGRSKTAEGHMVFHVTSGKLVFSIRGLNNHEYVYDVQAGLTVHVPPNCVYSIKNLQRTKAECFYVVQNMSQVKDQ